MIVIVLWVQVVLLLGLVMVLVAWWWTSRPAWALAAAGVMAGTAVTDAVNATSWSAWLVCVFTACAAGAWVVLWRAERRHARPRLGSPRDTSVTLQGWFTDTRSADRALAAWRDTHTGNDKGGGQ